MKRLRRRRFLRIGGLAALGSVAGCSAPTEPAGEDDGSGSTGGASGTTEAASTGSTPNTRVPTPTETGRPTPTFDGSAVVLEPVASGFSAPLDFVAPEGTDRRFVVDRNGRIWAVSESGRRETPFLDLADRIILGSERGLLGVAAHPSFASNGRLYVRYSASSRAGTPDGYSHTSVLAEFTVDPTAQVAEDPRERTLLEVPQPQGNHDAGAIAFGPEGYLYVPFGDGGGANDVGQGHADDWYDTVDGGNGQDVTANLLGSVLRIDVDGRGGVEGRDADKPYAIPEENPLVGREGAAEQYAWGFRNPWRLSFHGSDCYVADVGQNAWEEVNLLEAGGNYGWNVREGAHCFQREECPTTGPDGQPFVDPVAEYPHEGGEISGISIIGGHVATGDAVPNLRGAYVFSDFVARGRLFAVDPGREPPWTIATVPVTGDTELGQYVLGFGRDQAGDVYALTTNQSGGDGESGRLLRLAAP
ncbi:MAG: sorbosone dehydrogenase family protein [Halobellus sp.]|uniref:PQQ-dependent sugar dehydrogenase n=1 Tax=Halobellus sp. TaxID=1979212 RepID=UPI0035D52774